MENKKADNKIYETKNKIAIVDDQISLYNDKLKNIDYSEETFNSLRKSIDKCSKLLNKAVKSKRTERITSSMEENNQIYFSRVRSSCEDERNRVKKQINDANIEKDKLNEKLKEIIKSQENTEKETQKDDVGSDLDEDNIN